MSAQIRGFLRQSGPKTVSIMREFILCGGFASLFLEKGPQALGVEGGWAVALSRPPSAARLQYPGRVCVGWKPRPTNALQTTSRTRRARDFALPRARLIW